MNDKSIKVTEAAKIKLKELIASKPEALGVRIEILAGGCSGFKYRFGYLTQIEETDIITDLGDMKIAIDNYSCTKLVGR